MRNKKFHSIPTNIITGFLGVGKTTVIRHLLKTKPANEQWAVLVNEFGEVGIDGALLNADGIAVKEVPGGCMCCSVGVPSRTALNNLIRETNPDRIIIEPTGLAHPKQVLDMFSAVEYRDVLDLRAVVCLVDPWCLSEARFLGLPAFHDQIAMADVLIATKKDVSQADHLAAFADFAEKLQPAKARVDIIAAGEMPWQLLDIQRGQDREAGVEVHLHHGGSAVERQLPEPDSEGVVRIENESSHGGADHSVSCGWLFPSTWQFDVERLTAFIDGLPVPRVKGVFATERGWVTINKMRTLVSSEAIESGDESRVEMINLEPIDWLVLDRQLRRCRLV